MNRQRTTFSGGSEFESEFAYSRVVVDGDWVFVAGTTGYDYSTMTLPNDAAEQATQCFENIKSALAQADATLADIVRVTYLITNRNDVPAFGPVFQTYLADIRPAATLQVVELLNEAMKIEIEVTARRRS